MNKQDKRLGLVNENAIAVRDAGMVSIGVTIGAS